MLSALADVVGSPYAELLWGHAAAAVVLGLASEFAYTSFLGLISGALYGFASGYVGAVRGSVGLVARGALRGVGAAAAVCVKALRVLSLLPGCRQFRQLLG